jgi:hypothetical protein
LLIFAFKLSNCHDADTGKVSQLLLAPIEQTSCRSALRRSNRCRGQESQQPTPLIFELVAFEV